MKHCNTCGMHADSSVGCCTFPQWDECFRATESHLCTARIVASAFLEKLHEELCIGYTGCMKSSYSGWDLDFPTTYTDKPFPISEFLKQSPAAKALLYERFRAFAATNWPD